MRFLGLCVLGGVLSSIRMRSPNTVALFSIVMTASIIGRVISDPTMRNDDVDDDCLQTFIEGGNCRESVSPSPMCIFLTLYECSNGDRLEDRLRWTDTLAVTCQAWFCAQRPKLRPVADFTKAPKWPRWVSMHSMAGSLDIRRSNKARGTIYEGNRIAGCRKLTEVRKKENEFPSLSVSS